MKQSGLFIRIMSVLLTFCLSVTMINSSSVISAAPHEYNDNYENMTAAEKQAYLEQNIKELNQKLNSLGAQSKETEGYIDTLNDKISFLQRELELSSSTIENSKNKITSLENQYKDNEAEIEKLMLDIDKLNDEQQSLQSEFDDTFEQYAKRARALYISGNMSTLSMIITSGDISTLFTRLEMIKRVSRADRELLEGLQLEVERLISASEDLKNKKVQLTENQATLASTKENLEQTIKTLELQQTSFNEKEKTYIQEKDEADRLLLKLHEETQTYSEYRNQDMQELSLINAEIERAAEEWLKKQESLTTTTTTTTTTQNQTNANQGDTTAKPTTTTTTITQRQTTASGRLQMTYPVPSQTKITCGWQGYAGHTGVDFACNSNSQVVAAEDGEVIISKDLKNPDGSYKSYGRYIVIAHYKKNSSGNFVYTLYAHNSSRLVAEGDVVKKGQLIAYSGSTGNSTGPHCHFEVRTPSASYNDCVNPTPYLP